MIDGPRAARLLRAEELDGWLFCYFRGNDPVAERLLDVGGRFFTRRWFYWLPARGAPVKIVHRIEPDALDHLPGRARLYAGREALFAVLKAVLAGRTAALQYSPRADVPTISRVDAGTVELLRAAGARPVSSGDLVQALDATLSPRQKSQHRRTALDLTAIARDALSALGRRLKAGGRSSEGEVRRRIQAAFARTGLVTNAPPIVAAGANSARPHYAGEGDGAAIRKGDWVLVDLWAKPRGAGAIYADITWCAYAGPSVPGRYERVFQTVRRARDAAVDLVRRRYGREPVPGWQVDRAARRVIEAAGLGRFFTHRTGHSIHTEDHADGANMDGFETRETRRLLPDTLFSVEPGVYLPGRFGARSEINVLLDGPRALVTTPPQDAVLPLLR